MTVQVEAGAFTVRPFVPSDEANYVSYWHDGIADLEFLGIDGGKLGGTAETRKRFAVFMSGERPRAAFGYCILAKDGPVGFINVNVFGRERGTPHFHLTVPAVRRGGLMTAVLRECLDRIVADVFEESGADGLTIEVRTRNSAMNAVLQKLGHPIVATRDLAAPDGLAGSGTFNFYEIDRGATQRS